MKAVRQRAAVSSRSLRLGWWLFAALLLFAGTAAASSVKWKRTTITEQDGSWKLDLAIYLNKPPAVAHVPVRFSFTPIVVYERSLVDGKEGPQLTRLPLAGQQPIIESVDVGFLDPGRGKIENRTRFSFHITRDHGFEAGEYEVVIKTSESQQIGGTTQLILQGDNEVVDRRSMVFEPNQKPKQEEKAKPQSTAVKNTDPTDDSYWSGGPTEPAEEEPTEIPPPVSERPGACGCRIFAPASTGLPALLAVSIVGLAVLRRTRRD